MATPAFKFTPIPRRDVIRTEPLATYRATLAALYRKTRQRNPALARLTWSGVGTGDLSVRLAKAYVGQVMNEPSA